MPSTSASASETKSSFEVPVLPYCAPGLSSFSPPSPTLSTALPSRLDRLKPYLPSTHTVIANAPMISSVALMICTHVVPRMPPMIT